jgi:hypothetical protein
MVLGGVSCPEDLKEEVFHRIRSIKAENGLGPQSEMKWTKISTAKISAYKDLINYFFDIKELSFRSVVVDKGTLDHEAFAQTHDQFYYKMYWQMLEWFIEPLNTYHIYLDLKDTQGVTKVSKLHEVLCNSKHDFNREVISRIQEVRSHEIALLQIADILIGAIAYANRFPEGGRSEAKNEMVRLVKARSSFSLRRSTSLGARKFNIFSWEGQR